MRLDQFVCKLKEGVLNLRAVKNDKKFCLLLLLILDVVHDLSKKLDGVFILVENVILVSDLEPGSLSMAEAETRDLPVLLRVHLILNSAFMFLQCSQCPL
jgi:hypothetical protein